MTNKINRIESDEKYKAELILANYEYCVITPMKNKEELKSIHCNYFSEVVELIEIYSEILIESPQTHNKRINLQNDFKKILLHYNESLCENTDGINLNNFKKIIQELSILVRKTYNDELI